MAVFICLIVDKMVFLLSVNEYHLPIKSEWLVTKVVHFL